MEGQCASDDRSESIKNTSFRWQKACGVLHVERGLLGRELNKRTRRVNTRMQSWLALGLILFLAGCLPDGGGGGGGGGSEGPGVLIIYRADQTIDTVPELFDANSGAKLNPPLGLPQSVQAFAVTPDKTAVVYIADELAQNVFELFRVNLGAPGVSAKLNAALVASGDVHAFQLIPDGSGVVYLADQDTDGVDEVYRVLFSNPQNSTKLNGPLILGGNVVEFDVTSDSSRVVYRADEDIDNVFELFQNTLPPTGTSTKLHSNYAAGQSVSSFELLPNSSGVLYLANQTTLTVVELYETLFAGGTIGVRVNDVLVTPGGNVIEFSISADSTRVVYRADQITDGRVELFRVQLSALGSSTRLNNPAMQANGNVGSFIITPDSSSAVFIADQDTDELFELYRTVFNNPPPLPTKLTGTLITGSKDVFNVVAIPNSSGVVYIADQDTTGIREVYRVGFSAPGFPTKLNPNFGISGGQAQEIAVTPDSGSVVYRANQSAGAATQLSRVFFSSPGSSTTLNGPLVPGGNVEAFAMR